jgi:hypothetical protein
MQVITQTKVTFEPDELMAMVHDNGVRFVRRVDTWSHKDGRDDLQDLWDIYKGNWDKQHIIQFGARATNWVWLTSVVSNMQETLQLLGCGLPNGGWSEGIYVWDPHAHDWCEVPRV